MSSFTSSRNPYAKWVPDFPSLNDFHSVGYSERYQEAMSWLRDNRSSAELKISTQIWCENRGLDWENYSSAPDWQFITVGRMAEIENLGGVLSPSSRAWMDSALNSSISRSSRQNASKSDDSDVVVDLKLSSSQKQTIEFVNLMSSIDQIRVRNKNRDDIQNGLMELINKNKPSKIVLKNLINHYIENRDLSLSNRGTVYEDQLELAILISVVDILVAIRDGVVDNRKSSSVSVSIDSRTGVVGIAPKRINGAKCAILYNVEKRQISVISALENSELSIDGNVILNFDANVSFVKTLRKPEDMLIDTNLSSRRRCIGFFRDQVSSKSASFGGRIGKSTLVLRAFK